MNFAVHLPFFNNFVIEAIKGPNKNDGDIIIVLKHKLRPAKTCLLCLEKDIEESSCYGVHFEILSARHVQEKRIVLDWMPINMISTEMMIYWLQIIEFELNQKTAFSDPAIKR